jgi:hypothetical protein
MAQFPKSEGEILILAQNVVAGLTANPTTYPAPPVTAIELGAVLDSFVTLQNDVVAAKAAFSQAVTTKNAGLEELTDAIKAILRYAENTVDFDDDLLKLLGWAGRKAGVALEAPGQCRNLEAAQQGDGWVALDWKRPVEGGAVHSYKIERRERPVGEYVQVDSAYESEAILINQERGKEWEYRVIGGNTAGDGPPSNTVPVVL